MKKTTAIAIVMALLTPAQATWKPEYAAAPLEIQEWFKTLRSPAGGLCCDLSDGQRVDDVEWGTTGDPDAPYWVVVNGERVIVPADCVVSGSNRLGPALVWPIFMNGKVFVRCFMPGAMG